MVPQTPAPSAVCKGCGVRTPVSLLCRARWAPQGCRGAGRRSDAMRDGCKHQPEHDRSPLAQDWAVLLWAALGSEPAANADKQTHAPNT